MDLEKIAASAMAQLANSGTTHQINFNFNDIHHNQNVYLGADGNVVTSSKGDEYDDRGQDVEKAENGEPVNSSQFSITAERWVEKYESKIDSKLKGENLVKHVEKLRLRYSEAKAANKSRWITAFLRDNIFCPKQPWLNDIYSFSHQAIVDLFDDKIINKDAVSRAKRNI